MRVGTRVGRYYVSQRVGCGSMLLLTGLTVGLVGAFIGAVAASFRDVATATSSLVWVGLGLAAVCALVWLCVYLGHRSGPAAGGMDPDGDPIRPYHEEH